MGQSTNGQICFGVLFEEETSMPWDGGDFDGDWEKWQAEVRGFRHKLEDPYDEHGEYKPGFDHDDPRVDAWMKEESDWKNENPAPFEVVNVCSGEHPIYVIAVPSTCQTASRGTPVEIFPDKLKFSEIELVNFRAFVGDFFPHANPEAKWYLSSYWG